LQNAPLRAGMGSAYEGGLRVPMIWRWPGVARPGLRSGTPVTVGDLFPTLLRAARVATVTQVTRNLSGRDLASTLDNTKPVSFDRPLLWHTADYAPAATPATEPFSALRAGSWKLIYFYRGSRYELYDLSNDIGESRERSLRQPEIASKLSELMRRALTDAKPPMPIDSAYGRPYALPGRLIVPGPPPAPPSPSPTPR
jgi:arylsulfatase A-like enzyme